MSLLVKIAIMAFTYGLVGYCALALAIPPGFASAVFPPIGIALGALLLFGRPLLLGVFVGSFCLNLFVSYENTQVLAWSGVAVAIGIALGSCLAVFVGERVCRFILKGRPAFSRESDIAYMLVAAGPVSCLISASTAVLVLYFAHVIGQADMAYTWWTWWIGDSIGVMLALPLVFIAFARPRQVWRQRWMSVGVPLIITTALMVVVFIRINRADLERIEQSFDHLSVPFVSNFKGSLEAQVDILKSIDSLFQASNNVSYLDFVHFTQNALEDNPVLYALSWNRYISHAEREKEERALGDRGLLPHIKERLADGQLTRASVREDYTFVKYISPMAGNEKAQSFDVGSVANRRQALLAGANSNQASMTPPIRLVQDTVERKALLVFYPVYKKGKTQNSLANTLGFATGVIVMEQLLHNLLADYSSGADFNVRVDYLGSSPESIAAVANSRSSILSPYVYHQQEFEFAGSTLRITVEPSEKFVARHISSLTWTVLAGGFLFCSLLGGFLLSLSIRSERIQELVTERTTELSSILNSATDVILTLDSEGCIHRFNKVALNLLGVTSIELRGSSIFQWLTDLSKEGASPAMFFQENRDSVFATTLVTKEQQRVAVEVGVSQIILEKQPHYVMMLHDITEWKKTEKLKSEFISTVSHELRTPLTSIIGSLKLVEAGVSGDVNDATKKLVGIARENTERLNTLVNDILDVEKLEFDRISIEIMPVPILSTVHQLVEQMQVYADGYSVEILLKPDVSLGEDDCVLADRHRLLQILTNLLSNAIKYSKEGGQVTLSLVADQQQLVFSVKDNGRGMPEFFRKRIFQKFSQADSTDTREKSGTGLGLYISKTLTEKMGGSISFESELGKGSEFFVRLPLA